MSMLITLGGTVLQWLVMVEAEESDWDWDWDFELTLEKQICLSHWRWSLAPNVD